LKPEVYQRLAATGRYYNTGKVLIGLLCEPRPHKMHTDACLIQGALLRRTSPNRVFYIVFCLVICLFTLVAAVVEIVS
jgi:hypothetical protein